MGDNRVLDEALAIIGEAIKLDNDKKYAEALNKYQLGIERIIHVIRCTCGPQAWLCGGTNGFPVVLTSRGVRPRLCAWPVFALLVLLWI
jgi:hypothetical protein